MEILSLIIEDGFRTAGIVALLVLSYKVYRCKIHSDGESSCVKCFLVHFTTVAWSAGIYNMPAYALTSLFLSLSCKYTSNNTRSSSSF